MLPYRYVDFVDLVQKDLVQDDKEFGWLLLDAAMKEKNVQQPVVPEEYRDYMVLIPLRDRIEEDARKGVAHARRILETYKQRDDVDEEDESETPNDPENEDDSKPAANP